MQSALHSPFIKNQFLQLIIVPGISYQYCDLIATKLQLNCNQVAI